MEQKTNTSIYKVYEPNHEFPVITICNLNPFDTYSLSTYNYLTSLLMSQNLQMNATAMNMLMIKIFSFINIQYFYLIVLYEEVYKRILSKLIVS